MGEGFFEAALEFLEIGGLGSLPERFPDGALRGLLGQVFQPFAQLIGAEFPSLGELEEL